jgi:hypothetical protein
VHSRVVSAILGEGRRHAGMSGSRLAHPDEMEGWMTARGRDKSMSDRAAATSVSGSSRPTPAIRGMDLDFFEADTPTRRNKDDAKPTWHSSLTCLPAASWAGESADPCRPIWFWTRFSRLCMSAK